MPKYYYHLTTKEALPNILKYGLQPRIGIHSKLVGERSPSVFLCAHRDIPYWKIILQLPVILKIKADNIEIPNEQIYHYDTYAEYIYKQTIPPDAISVLHQHSKTYPIAMRELCLSYLRTISYLCVTIARYYTYKDTPFAPDWITEDSLKQMLISNLLVLQHLDYNICSAKTLRKELYEIGDGGYSFTDHYMYNNQSDITSYGKPRLYTMLIRFEKDTVYPLRHQLYKFITKNFKSILSIETGGWTG